MILDCGSYDRTLDPVREVKGVLLFLLSVFFKPCHDVDFSNNTSVPLQEEENVLSVLYWEHQPLFFFFFFEFLFFIFLVFIF